MRPHAPRARRSGSWATLCAVGAFALLLLPVSSCQAQHDPASLRERMVKTQIEARGVDHARVLQAMRAVPRHLFVPRGLRPYAYEDRPLPIGSGQTISQPYMVAVMTALLDPQPNQRVLEVGTGSGYQAAVLAELVAEVYSIEIVPDLAQSARERLDAAGYPNVVVITGDGYLGLPDRAPFDGILVTAAPEKLPEPLLEQLKLGGRLVIPVGGDRQWLQVVERTPEGFRTEQMFEVRFVPMTGKAQEPGAGAPP